MKGLAPLFLGIFGTFAFSWMGLTVIPNWQIGHLNPQSDEEGTDTYPMPQSGMVARGAHVYAANGCIYCHSQQVRADYSADDIERKWGDRRSAPRDYIFERPVFLGKMRMGQDLANIGARAPLEQESPRPAEPQSWRSPAAAPLRPGQARRRPGRPSPVPASPAPNQLDRLLRRLLLRHHQGCSPIASAIASPGTAIRLPRAPAASPLFHVQMSLRFTAPCCAGPPWPEQYDWRTADVFRCLASCSSLFAAQYQRRFGHALLSLSLSSAPHQ